MHTVVEKLCTGCELCIPPCPVECIYIKPVGESLQTWKWKYPVVNIRPVPVAKHVSKSETKPQ